MMLSLVTPPASAVALADAKAHLRVDHDDEDALISALIDAATDHFDGYSGVLGRAIMPQTWEMTFDRFPSEIVIPLGPVQSVVSVTYTDAEGADAVIDPTDYDVSLSRGIISPVPGASWPVNNAAMDSVRVRFIAGGAVPTPVKQAILLLVSHWYEQRSAVSAAAMSEIPLAVSSLIAPLRRGML